MIAWTCQVCRKIAEWADRLDDKAICPSCLKGKIETQGTSDVCAERGYHKVKSIVPEAAGLDVKCHCGEHAWVDFARELHPIDKLVGRLWSFTSGTRGIILP